MYLIFSKTCFVKIFHYTSIPCFQLQNVNLWFWDFWNCFCGLWIFFEKNKPISLIFHYVVRSITKVHRIVLFQSRKLWPVLCYHFIMLYVHFVYLGHSKNYAFSLTQRKVIKCVPHRQHELIRLCNQVIGQWMHFQNYLKYMCHSQLFIRSYI